MLIILLGSAGIGLVWGFLAASVEGQLRHPLRTGVALALATLLIASEIFLLGNWQALLCFFGASTVAFTVRISWHRELRSRSAT
jgi:hypothetical protein